jgi:hypothetical protein
VQVYVGISLVLLTTGIAHLRTIAYAVALQAWASIVATAGCLVFLQLYLDGHIDTALFAGYALVSLLTISTVHRAALVTRE